MRAVNEPLASDRSAAGYNLVVLMMIITVMNIMLAVAMPVWSHAARREKEEELIFRGLQYAEAIRVFQRRHGRGPTRLEELIEVEPRAIRQLWTEPMSEHGAWGLLIQRGAPAQQSGVNPSGELQSRRPVARRAPPGLPRRGQPGGDPEDTQVGGQANPNAPDPPNQGRPGGGQQAMVPIPPKRQSDGTMKAIATGGQIMGVYSPVGEESIRTFLGSESYDQWHFTVQLIPAPAVAGGDAPLPRVNSAWIGRPFREGLQVKTPGVARPGAGQNLTPGAGLPTRDQPRGQPTRGQRGRGRRQ